MPRPRRARRTARPSHWGIHKGRGFKALDFYRAFVEESATFTGDFEDFLVARI
jgi:hypothetical protein